MLWLDADGRVREFTPAAEALVAAGSGPSLDEFSTLLNDHELRADVREVAKDQTVREREIFGDDGRVYLRRALPSRTVAGGASGVVVTYTDLSEQRRAQVALAAAEREVVAASEAKDHFLANISHELRTPLAAIVLWTSLIDDQEHPEPVQLKNAVAAIKRSAEEQRELIEELVDTSRIVAGKLKLDLRKAEILSVVRAALDSVRAAAEEKGIDLAESLDRRAGIAELDADRMQHAISNLLHNAVKFTPAQGSVRLALRRRGPDIEIRVTDSGRGIAAEFLPHVFERFGQEEKAASRSESGLGLGLTVARQIVELHGGSLQAESEGAGRGATFVMRLPLPPSGAEAQPAAPNGAKFQLAHSLRGRHVLLIEDVPNTRRALTAVLREAGAEVTAVDSALPALEAFGRRRPDLILSDIGLPYIDGFDLVRRIREMEKVRHTEPVPAVALTAFAGEEVPLRAAESGFQKCLIKPADPLHLVSTLAALGPN